MEPFLADASNFHGKADGVFFPANEKDVVEFLCESDGSQTPVTIAGYGTGLTGARVPLGGWVMAMHAMNAVEVQEAAVPGGPARAIVAPGVQLKDLQAAAAEHNYFYPPDPTSILSFLGGNVATNASGSRAFKYGVTRDHVLRLRLVLANGCTTEISRGKFFADRSGRLVLPVTTPTGRAETLNLQLPAYTSPFMKHAAGYFVRPGMDAIDLFIGSEGTLGVVTEMEVNLLPEPPQILSFVVFFTSEEDAWSFTHEARLRSVQTRQTRNDVKIEARSFEYLDEGSLNLVRAKYPDLPAGARAAVYLEQECQQETAEWLLDQWNMLFEKHRASLEDFWFSDTVEGHQKFKAFRHQVPLEIKALLITSGQTKVGTDYAVPLEYFSEMRAFELRRLNEEQLTAVSFGHMADCHLHLNILPKDDDEHEKAMRLYGELVTKALEMGGTIAAEHGVGKIKTAFLRQMFGEKAVLEMIALKKTLDPRGILGRGTLFPEALLG